MNFVTLADAAIINPRGPSPSELSTEEMCDFVPMAAVKADGSIGAVDMRPYSEVMKGYTSFKCGDVLLAKITPCFENNKIALARTSSKFAFGSTEFHVIRPKAGILDSKYLSYFLRQDRIRFLGENRMTGTAGQRRVPKSFVAELNIPLPPFKEQCRIAAILDKADAIHRKREHALALADNYLRSVYVHTLGYLSPNYEQWVSMPIEKLAKDRRNSIRSGPFGSALRHSEFVDEGIAVLGIDNAVKNRFVWGERRFISSEKYKKLHRYKVFPGDVIVTIMGTTGRSAVVPEDIPEAITTKHLATISCDKEQIHPEVLSFAIHSDPMIIRQINVHNKGAIMDGLNLGVIRKLKINRPPMEKQIDFVSLLSKFRKLSTATESPCGSGADLFSSLSQRAFRGEM